MWLWDATYSSILSNTGNVGQTCCYQAEWWTWYINGLPRAEISYFSPKWSNLSWFDCSANWGMKYHRQQYIIIIYNHLFYKISLFLNSSYFTNVLQNLNKTYNANVPLVLMNSFNTDEETQLIIQKYTKFEVSIN